jgi:DUF4097 and DUF4098 domain-containing protein YvlB
MTVRTRLFVCLIPAALGASACEVGISAGGVEGSFERRLAVTGPLNLEVQSGSGTIQVRQGDTGTVQVLGRARAGFGDWINFNGASAAERVREIESNPPVEQSGNTIRIGKSRANVWDGVSISYNITVPANTRVIARSGSGDLIIGDLSGPVEASTGSGDIRIGRTSEAVRATAGSGDIELDGARSVVARTGSGSVRALSVGGDIEVHSGSGEVTVAQQEAGRVEVSTGSGDIEVRGARGPMHVRASSGDVTVEGTPAATWDVSASSGDVSVQVPADAAFDLDAHSSSGRIETAFPVTTTSTLSKRELRGQVRGGGPRVEVSTSSGGIRIR